MCRHTIRSGEKAEPVSVQNEWTIKALARSAAARCEMDPWWLEVGADVL